MKHSKRNNRSILKNESGQGMTEYIILLVLVAVACITAVNTLGGTIKDKLQGARNRINSVSYAE